MRPFGRVLFAYSGANAAFLPGIARAPLRDLSVDRLPAAYIRERSRRAPYNLFVDPRRLASTVSGATSVPDVGFRFGPPLPGGRPAKSATVSYPAARMGFSWSADERRWLWSMDGSAARSAGGKRLGAATVVVQYVTVDASPYRDVNGAPTPYSRTVGRGSAVVLRDGQAWDATWSRPKDTSTTAYTVGGQPATFAEGPVYVVLAPKGRPAVLR